MPTEEFFEMANEELYSKIDSFLSYICIDIANELKEMSKDPSVNWRFQNIISIIEKAKFRLDYDFQKPIMKLNSKVGFELIHNASKESSSELQDYWAGLLITSLSNDAVDDSGIIYVKLLNELTSDQVKMLNYACRNAKTVKTDNGLIFSDNISLSFEEMSEIFNIDDVNKLDYLLDHLRALSVLTPNGGFSSDENHLNADFTPTALAINLFSRCNGISGNPVDFLELINPNN